MRLYPNIWGSIPTSEALFQHLRLYPRIWDSNLRTWVPIPAFDAPALHLRLCSSVLLSPNFSGENIRPIKFLRQVCRTSGWFMNPRTYANEAVRPVSPRGDTVCFGWIPVRFIRTDVCSRCGIPVYLQKILCIYFLFICVCFGPDPICRNYKYLHCKIPVV
jgi:hypothetical protein